MASPEIGLKGNMPDVWLNLSASINLALPASLQNKELQMSMEKVFTDFYLAERLLCGIWHYATNINSGNKILAENERDVKREMRIACNFLDWKGLEVGALLPSVVLIYEVISLRF